MSLIERAIEEQFETFMSGTASEYAFPTGLSVEERKLVKSTAEKLGFSSSSFGMGSERQIHIFKPASWELSTLEPIKYSVKNTFVDGPLGVAEPNDALAGRAHQSMPVGSFEEVEHLPAELNVAGTSLGKENASSRNSEVDTGSTVDSDSEACVPSIPVKNSFVHFEADSKENADPRIVQSMPAGAFAQSIEAEKAAQATSTGAQKKASHLSLILPFSEGDDVKDEKTCAEVFPSTPNAENFISFDALHSSMIATPKCGPEEAIAVVQWVPPATITLESSVVVLQPAVWSSPVPAGVPSSLPQAPPQAPTQAPTVVPPQALPQAPTQALQGLPQQMPQASTPSAQPHGPPPVGLMPGTHIVLQGLANQPDFNGLSGTVSGFDAESGRYDIMLQVSSNATKRLVKVKSQNLLLAQPVMAPQPPYCPCIQQHGIANRTAKASLVLDHMV